VEEERKDVLIPFCLQGNNPWVLAALKGHLQEPKLLCQEEKEMSSDQDWLYVKSRL
jgi:hypothetical protein